MPHSLPPGAATGGLVGALVTSLVHQEPTLPPLTCQDFGERSDLHGPSLCLGILCGLLLAQLLDLLSLLRQYLTTTIRQKALNLQNAWASKRRLA